MPEFAPTIQQKNAIEARGSAVLVSAAAGSGKTKVLTERLMSYLTETPPKRIDSFLIITYTRAAAGELRARIMDDLTQRIAREPDNLALRQQYALLPRAQIGTIHRFCKSLLQEHCLPLGLSPDFQVADENQISGMKQSALTKTLESAYTRIDTNPGFRLLVDTVGAGRNDRRLESLILKLHEKVLCHPYPDLWVEQQRKALYAEGINDAGDTIWGRYLLDIRAKDAAYWAEAMDELLAIMAQPEYGYIGEKYAKSIAETADALRSFAHEATLGWDKAAAQADIPFPKLGTLRNPKDPDVAESIRNRRNICKKICGGLKTEFSQPSEKILSDLRRIAPAMDALLNLTLEFDRAYQADKRRRGVVDYSDLEHFSAQLLADENGSPTPLAIELSQRYTEIMVDEYQDVNAVQDLIFRCISKDGKNLFTVGDVKQSIYRFRLANPAIFTEKYLTYADYGTAAEGMPQRILLQQNFRSRQEVLNAVNAVFENIMSAELGELDYDVNARLNLGANYQGAVSPPTLYLLRAPGDDEEEPDTDKAGLEAGFVAERIQSLIRQGLPVTDGGVQRPARYGDIVLLMRSPNKVSDTYRRELAAQGIPVQSEQGGEYYKTPEISLMRSLLAIIDNPLQDVPLIAVLRSPYLAFSPDELAEIRTCGRKLSFYDALCLRAQEDEKCRVFLDTLKLLRKIAPDLSLADFLWLVYNKFSILTISSAMEDGEARRKNLMILIDQARNFESSGYQGLRRFIQWLNRQAEENRDPAIPPGDSGNAVRIMSIHRSKGLEFPIVFLCDTAHSFNKADTRETVLVHDQMGLGPKIMDMKRGIEYASMPRHALTRRITRELLSEEMRLLYVAMTRAKEYLYMSAVLNDPETVVNKLRPIVTSPISPQILEGESSLAKWLIAAALADEQHHLRIEFAAPQQDTSDSYPVSENAPLPADFVQTAQIAKNLQFIYPYENAQDIPSKITVTELKHMEDIPDPDAAGLVPNRPRHFRTLRLGTAKERLSAAQRGTATHLVFQHIHLTQTDTLEQVKHEIERLRLEHFLTEEQAAAVDAQRIYRFFASPEGQEIKTADNILREFKFSLLQPADTYFPGIEDDTLLLQGVIDCAAEKDGAYTIIDYKTDRVTTETVYARAELYRSQIQSYAAALTSITGKPVKKSVLYFLHPGISITF